MKKIIVQILLFVIIFNSIFNSFCGYKVAAMDPQMTITQEDMDQVDQDATTPGKGGAATSVDAANTQSTAPSIMGTLASLIGIVPMLIMQLVKVTVETFGFVNIQTLSATEIKEMTRFLDR